MPPKIDAAQLSGQTTEQILEEFSLSQLNPRALNYFVELCRRDNSALTQENRVMTERLKALEEKVQENKERADNLQKKLDNMTEERIRSAQNSCQVLNNEVKNNAEEMMRREREMSNVTAENARLETASSFQLNGLTMVD